MFSTYIFAVMHVFQIQFDNLTEDTTLTFQIRLNIADVKYTIFV